MNSEIIAVGTEILLGDICNTHAQFLSQELASLGINVLYHTTVGDNRERLRQTVQRALDRNRLYRRPRADDRRFDQRDGVRAIRP